MNWPLIVTCIIFGLLFAGYNVGTGITILEEWPTRLQWLKLGASGGLAFVIGVFTFMRDPGQAWKQSPGAKGGNP